MKKIPTQLWNEFLRNTLFRNSVYLMLGTGILAGCGFFFWLINAHLFSVENIGLATTLISVMNLVALLSLAGFDSVFIRFLPTSNQKNEKMNTGLIIVSIASILLATGFLLGVNIISPRLSFITKNPIYEIIFVLACAMNALNVLTDSVFLAGRKTIFTLIINILLCIVKIIIPFFFVSFGAIGIFIAAALAQTLGTVLSVGVMIWKFDYRPRFNISKDILKIVWRYSTTNHIAGVLNLLPPTVLPILITNTIGPEASAYYYIVMMMGNLLYTIPWSISRSLFAEGSHDESFLENNIKKLIKIIGSLLIPSMIILLFFGSLLLQIFGKSYSNGGHIFLYLVIFSALSISVNAIFGSFFRIKKSLRIIIISNILYTILLIGLSIVLLPLGLIGIGIAWFLGNLAYCAVNLTLLYLDKSSKSPSLF